MARAGILLGLAVAAAVTAAAFERTLTPNTIAEAITIGQSRMDDVRSRFHAVYRRAVAQPPVDYIEIVTPLRRVAIDAEAHTHAGERLYGQREALLVLGDDPARIDVVVELTFHPMNTYLGVPNFSVRLQGDPPASAVQRPKATTRIPRFGPRLSGIPLPYPYMTAPPARNGSQPLLGGSIVATFAGEAVDPRGTYLVVINEGEKDVAQAQVNFGTLR